MAWIERHGRYGTTAWSERLFRSPTNDTPKEMIEDRQQLRIGF